jgi:hypothetical protein
MKVEIISQEQSFRILGIYGHRQSPTLQTLLEIELTTWEVWRSDLHFNSGVSYTMVATPPGPTAMTGAELVQTLPGTSFSQPLVTFASLYDTRNPNLVFNVGEYHPEVPDPQTKQVISISGPLETLDVPNSLLSICRQRSTYPTSSG